MNTKQRQENISKLVCYGYEQASCRLFKTETKMICSDNFSKIAILKTRVSNFQVR